MKELKDMTTNELINWASGEVIVAIGEGKFKERMGEVVMTIQALTAKETERKIKKDLEKRGQL